MPEYVAPGVYVEEVSFRSKSIEGVSTSTTGFVGPTRRGPVGDTPELITSLADFERVYGGLDNLAHGLNYLAHSVRAYFDEGGGRLYVSRVFLPAGDDASGHASSSNLLGGATEAEQARFVARFPGHALNGRIELRQIAVPATRLTMESAPEGTLLRVGGDAPPGQVGAEMRYYVKRGSDWRDRNDGALDLSGVQPADAPVGGADFLTLNIIAQDRDGSENWFDELGFDRDHPRWVGAVLAESPSSRAEFLENMYALRVGPGVSAFELRDGLFLTGEVRAVTLSGGDDGAEPTAAAYEAALAPFNGMDDISTVAAPGHGVLADFQGIQLTLISHVERQRAYRIAVLETPPHQTPGEARTVRSRIDSRHAALYYPWIIISNPLARPGVDAIPREIIVPPSGFICGIYARNDVERGVHKAPANQVVRGALRFEVDINFAQQEMLNPIGVNCLRFFPGRGYRVWGARTVSSDPEWKYVNVRRYFNYIEHSVDSGTQWVVFEPNGEPLWAEVREAVNSFLYNEWRSGALLGSSPKEAFFVRCDRSTMTQNDLDNGRLICLVGVAVLKPAEFIIFRIGQQTADA